MKFVYKNIIVLISGFIFTLISCSDTGNINQQKYYDFLKVPDDFPPIPFPADNPFSTAKAELGRKLFYEPILSKDSTIQSCSHCMKQAHSFSDASSISMGFNGEPQYRNTMVFANLAYRKLIFWDGRASKIESPAYRSFFLPNVFNSDTNEINKRLQNHPVYPEMFRKAFGDSAKAGCYLASLALATFVRTLVSGNSNYDKYVRGDKTALNQSEIRGMDLFFSKRTRCSVCHSGQFFSDDKFHNTGVSIHYFDRGRYYITGIQSDRGKFLTPSLRNVELTAPYMHDGEMPDLESIIENYNRGGKPFINRDSLLSPLNLTQQEKNDLLAFLKSLTDWDFINNKFFSKPE